MSVTPYLDTVVANKAGTLCLDGIKLSRVLFKFRQGTVSRYSSGDIVVAYVQEAYV